jgi:putative ATPase
MTNPVMSQGNLFGAGPEPADRVPADAPLAERMRPRDLTEYAGQEHLVAPSRLVGEMMRDGVLQSLILWGPPGTGKTTLARLLAAATRATCLHFSAVTSGVKELRQAIADARASRARTGVRPVLFVDEIHRFNKAQQDALLPHVENGTVTLIGATTENPSFEVIAPLLSRCSVVVLEPLGGAHLAALLERALRDEDRGLGRLQLVLADDARAFLVDHAAGDARAALNALEGAASLATRAGSAITLAVAEEAAQRRALLYDKTGEEHYNVVSAFIKSMRGSDPDAAVYWLMRMLEAGEDPRFVARRMVIFASEDIGNADPHALPLAIAARDAFDFVGLPEGRIPLAHAATYLAVAPKSNAAYVAMQAAAADVSTHGALPVPRHLRNAPTSLMRGLGYGAGYEYAHDRAGAEVGHAHLPDALRARRYYEPTDRGAEREIKAHLASRKGKK